jgi:hypothetical protein
LYLRCPVVPDRAVSFCLRYARSHLWLTARRGRWLLASTAASQKIRCRAMRLLPSRRARAPELEKAPRNRHEAKLKSRRRSTNSSNGPVHWITSRRRIEPLVIGHSFTGGFGASAVRELTHPGASRRVGVSFWTDWSSLSLVCSPINSMHYSCRSFGDTFSELLCRAADPGSSS